MNKIREQILEEKLIGMEEETKKVYRIAECICRKEFEKAFNLNLDLPYGHPKNLIGIPTKRNIHNPLFDIIFFLGIIKR